jgi:hypothetical protein
MNFLEAMKPKTKNRLFWIACGFCFGITPFMFILADQERGFNATGGEMFIPLIPFMIKGLIETMKGDKENGQM